MVGLVVCAGRLFRLARRGNAHCVVGIPHGLQLGCVVAEQIARRPFGGQPAVHELAARGQIGSVEDAVVYACGLIPADVFGQQIGRVVGDAAVDVHAAIVVVLFHLPKLAHVRRLPVEAVGRVAVGRILQVAHRSRWVVLEIDDILSYQPVAAVDHGGKDIGERFVEGTRLEEVLQVYRATDDAVGHFVRGYIQRGRLGAMIFVAVAETHLHAIPKGASRLATFGDMDYRFHGATIAENTQAIVDPEEVVVYQGHIGVNRNRRRIDKETVGTDDSHYFL